MKRKKTRSILSVLLVVLMLVSLSSTVLAAPGGSRAGGGNSNRAGTTVTLSFNANSGSGAPSSISGAPGAAVTLPDTVPTRRNYTFLGWTTAKVSFPNTTYYAVYPAGSEYELPDSNSTLYAAWQSNNVSSSNTNAYFYIRLDGQIPYEPGSYEASDYTTGIRMTNAITVQNWVVDVDATKEIKGNHVANDVTAVLDKTPSDALIKRVVEAKGKTYDPETQYILWYVQKYQSLGSSAVDESGTTISTNDYGWHIDGVLLDRTKVSISYDANVPAGVTTVPDVPQGYQVVSGTTVTVGESGSVGGSTARQNPRIPGYTFMGWNTKADGSGISYSNGTQFALTENTTLYAIWSKSGNILTLNKVDGLGNSLDGASFTISGGSLTDSFTAGTYTNRSILTDTVYTITETNAPANYMGLGEAFHFIVSSQGGSGLTAYFCDANGRALTEDVPGVSLTYSSGAVNITVTNVGYFYIFHTADVEDDPSVVKVPINGVGGNWNADGTYNIVNETTAGCLYGGYYSDYAGKGNYTTPGTVNDKIDLSNSTTYKGDQTSWNEQNAYKASGFAITPVVGTTYYLKEVPASYIQPKIIYTYDKNTNPKNLLKEIYLVTAVDDQNYSFVGHDVAGSNYIEAVNGNVYDTITVKQKVSWNSDQYTTTTYQMGNFFPGISGYLNAQQYQGAVEANQTFSFTPFWVTLDGVKVTGVKTREVNTNNGYAAPTTAEGNALAVNDTIVATTVAQYTSGASKTRTLSLFSTFTINWDEDVPEEPVEPEETVVPEEIVEPEETVVPEEIVEPEETVVPKEIVEPEETIVTEETIEPEETVEIEEPEVIEYIITKIDGKKVVDVQTVEAGNQAGNITNPEKKGYVFAGWYTDSKLKNPADFSDVQGDMTVYAKYISERSVKVPGFGRKGH